jgi:hypothetical protein
VDVVDASLVAGGIKLATNRERPNERTGAGGFWPHGTRDYSLDSSFPSGHAAASWALARVIAAEYPGWLTKLGVYGFATAISESRHHRTTALSFRCGGRQYVRVSDRRLCSPASLFGIPG